MDQSKTNNKAAAIAKRQMLQDTLALVGIKSNTSWTRWVWLGETFKAFNAMHCNNNSSLCIISANFVCLCTNPCCKYFLSFFLFRIQQEQSIFHSKKNWYSIC